MFEPGSRYFHVRETQMETRDGETVVYKRRRLLPPLPTSADGAHTQVDNDDRTDRLAARILGDPLGFWRLCDANDSLHPEHLASPPGRWLRVPGRRTP